MKALLGLVGAAALVPVGLMLSPAGETPPRSASPAPSAGDGTMAIAIDAAAGQRPISPLIYGVNFGTTDQLRDLNSPVNRSGGDSASLYNPDLDARSAGADWFFESIKCDTSVYQQFGDSFVRLSHDGGAKAMLTMPMVGWQAKLGPKGERLAGFSIVKYGLQQKTDVDGMAEAGNGMTLEGKPITGNDPHDAAKPVGLEDRRRWMEAVVRRWGKAADGGVAFWLMDNEPTRWHDIHRGVQPAGLHASELEARVRTFSALVKQVDPTAKVVAPEEWGWGGYLYSGFDQQHGERGGTGLPDRDREQGGMEHLPWLLSRWKAAGRPVDVVSVHFYPQGGEYRDEADVSPRMQALRNRSTRLLWDRDYLDTSWIADKVALIPRLRRWVDQYYWPGTPIAITEYAWGGEASMNGATTQADVLGIFGREGLYLANRWAAPKTDSPTYLAMKIYRNADGRGGGFGETSVSAAAPDVDRLSAFAALRKADGALTLMVINKQPDRAAKLSVSLANFAAQGRLGGMRLADGALRPVTAGRFAGGRLALTVPKQSVTLFVLQPDPKRA